MWTYLLAGAGFAFAAAVQPGPFQTYLLSEALARGWRRTLPAALAPVLSDAPIVAIALLVLVRVPGELVRFLHLAGAVFLFYLARGAWRAWRQNDLVGEPEPGSDRRTFLKATLVNFLNPNPWLGWTLVMGPMFLTGYREAPSRGIALIVSFYVTMVVCLVGLITVFASARRLDPKVQKVFQGLSVLALAGFGLFQLWLGIWPGPAE
jgi:threonine/homoserine/homoserine lactone efflux protein